MSQDIIDTHRLVLQEAFQSMTHKKWLVSQLNKQGAIYN